MALGLMSLRTQLLIPTKGRKRAGCLYIGHQQGPCHPWRRKRRPWRIWPWSSPYGFQEWEGDKKLLVWRSQKECTAEHGAGCGASLGFVWVGGCVCSVCAYVRACVRLCVCTNSHCTDVWVCLWYTAARLFVGLWTYCPFYFSQCLDDLKLENTYNHVQD